MKYFVSSLMILLMFFLTSCSKDSSNPTGAGGLGGNGGNGGNGGTGSVSFTISTKPTGTANQVFFVVTPSTAIVITSITISLPAQNFSAPYTGDGTTVFPANSPQTINDPYTGVASGQQWVFVFTGKLGGSTGTAFTNTTNFTVP